jgi:formate C-acetyltransferase
MVHRIFWLAAIARKVQSRYMRLPFLSIMGIEKTMEYGQDLLIPHPDYTNFGFSDRALIDTADSLMSIKKLVYDDKKITMSELVRVLDSNFEGAYGEEVRQMCIKQPKYGNDIDEVTALLQS